MIIDELQLFRGYEYIVNDYIKITQPTLNEICSYGEQKYYNMVSTLCATPSDFKVQLLDNFNLDYEELTEFQFFATMCREFKVEETAILFGKLDLQAFELAHNNQNNELILYNSHNDFVIDNGLYTLITTHLRLVHGFKKKIDIGGNENGKKYLLDKERRQLQRQRNMKYESMLIPLISAMVNCEKFKYNHDTVWDLPIYTFMDSVRRIQKLQNYNQTMQGVYAGTIDFKSLSQDTLNWMGSLNKS